MCGIVGYVGKRAAPKLLCALRKLEYRGYDSAGGIAVQGEVLSVRRCTGRVQNLRGAESLVGDCGIGHTRWATHGAPTEANAHPHTYGRFSVVHNGIIENFRTLRAACEEKGETFSSETDSEVIAHLLEEEYTGDFLGALRRVAARLEGAYAIAALCEEEKGKVAVIRKGSPLIVGKGGGVWCASDIPAIARRGMEIFSLAEGESALLTSGGVSFYDAAGLPITKEGTLCDERDILTRREGKVSAMKREMGEIPAVLADSYEKQGKSAQFSAFYEVLCHAKYLRIVGCGTAYHAGLAAKYAFEGLARTPCEVCIASEFRNGDPILPEGTLLLAVSQSGETADTIAAAKLARERGACVAAVVNSVPSTLASLAHFVLPVHAGREVAVAATKSFHAQLLTLYFLAATLAEARGFRGYGDFLRELPALAGETLKASASVAGWAAHFVPSKSVAFIGRGADYVAALEGSLKLKEISYLPSEGYPAGELKHGTLALVEEGTPVVAIASSRLAEKTMNAVHEVRARGAKVFLVTSCAELCGEDVTASVLLPPSPDSYSAALSVIPLQQLAYYVALARGCDPDRPRNLAKSVTVE